MTTENHSIRHRVGKCSNETQLKRIFFPFMSLVFILKQDVGKEHCTGSHLTFCKARKRRQFEIVVRLLHLTSLSFHSFVYLWFCHSCHLLGACALRGVQCVSRGRWCVFVVCDMWDLSSLSFWKIPICARWFLFPPKWGNLWKSYICCRKMFLAI